MNRTERSRLSGRLLALLAPLALTLGPISAAAEDVPLDAQHWDLYDAEFTTHAGRACLMGTAAVKDVVFENGVIDVDMLMPRARTYAGINFRVQSVAEYEQIYIRPHRAPFYPDALQYTPVFNGVAGWQLYSGGGYTAAIELPYDEWVHVRLEVKGTQARVFVGDMQAPALEIHDLKHGAGSGRIGLYGRRDGNAYFSNFQYRLTGDLDFAPPAIPYALPGTVTEWELSQSFRLSDVDLERHPYEQNLGPIEWRRVPTEPTGLLDFSRYASRPGPGPACILARTKLTADADERREFSFGYSDAALVYLNGEILFSGASAYQQRDPSFLGIIGLFDSLHLPLKKGENELLFLIVDSFGGWGLVGQDGSPVFCDAHLQASWETPPELAVPESAVFDRARGVFYVSNYDLYGQGAAPGNHFISKLGRDGQILERQWVSGLRYPLGMVLDGDRLLVASRAELVEIDVASAKIAARYALPEAIFPNDIARDPRTGDLYISDSQRNAIYRFHEGTAEIWLSGPGIADPNGLLVQGDLLYVCNNGDRTLKAVRLADRSFTPVVRFYEGILDGLQSDGRGNLLLSIWDGRLYRVTPRGDAVKLLDTTNKAANCADFLFLPEESLLVVPTFRGNRVAAYRWTG
jgi:sugar lactone lactonase YvrE